MKKISKIWFEVRNFKPLKTAAQTAVALISTNAVGISDVDWVTVASASVLAAVLSFLTAFANSTPLRDKPEGRV
jgi:hypothetical protein